MTSSRKSRSSSQAALDETVGLVPGKPRGDKGEKDALAEDQAVRRVEVPPHPLGVDDEPVDEPGEAVEHVVEREERIGEHHSLRARVGDVALVPERDVLQAHRCRGAHHAREPGQALRHHGIALVRHRRGALLAAAKRLLHLAQLGSRQVADLGGEAVERGSGERERAEEVRVAVARHHLCRDGLRREAQPLAGQPLDLGVSTPVRPDGAGELANPHTFQRRREPGAIALQLERPAGELGSEGDGLGVDAVRPSGHDGVAVFLGAADHGRLGAIDALEDERSSLPDLKRRRGVQHIR